MSREIGMWHLPISIIISLAIAIPTMIIVTLFTWMGWIWWAK